MDHRRTSTTNSLHQQDFYSELLRRTASTSRISTPNLYYKQSTLNFYYERSTSNLYCKRIPSELLLQTNSFRTPVTGGLQSSFFNKRSPSGLLQEPDSVRTPVANEFRTNFYNRRAPAARFLQWPTASGVCHTSPAINLQ